MVSDLIDITQMIFFNQGMLLLGSNHFLRNRWIAAEDEAVETEARESELRGRSTRAKKTKVDEMQPKKLVVKQWQL